VVVLTDASAERRKEAALRLKKQSVRAVPLLARVLEKEDPARAKVIPLRWIR
jgi:hypothetical protein